MDIVRNMAIFLGSLLFLFLLITNAIHFRTQISDQQKIFLQGKIPETFPDGFYKGTVNGKELFWRGKKFNRDEKTGINVLKRNISYTSGTGEEEYEAYPFKTYTGKGAADRDIQVIKIDYNMKGNPLWLRPILDEIVEVNPDKYLGKVHLRLAPGISVALGWFELAK